MRMICNCKTPPLQYVACWDARPALAANPGWWSADNSRGGAGDERLRLCLLDLLDPADHGAVLAQLETARRERLGRLRRAETHCPCRHSFMRRWLAHETGRLDVELSWISRLASESTATPAL